ncbi:MAG: phosphohistidine phosphatase SixA [Spirochaetaceae bacterium]|nr:phosphohistidine phosphatase SixA [Spirochaetaceae bacterium]
MYLYLVQHGLSKSKEEDPQRGITDEGRIETAKTGNALAMLTPKIHEIWHSEKKRSCETAEILSTQLGLTAELVERKDLNPNDPVQSVMVELDKIDKNTMIVGHLPHLSRLLSKLLQIEMDREILQFQNSGIVCLKKEGTSWKLLWSVPPEILL